VGGQFLAITLKGHIIVVSYILMQCHDIKIAQHILLANNNIFINGRVSFEKWVKVCNSRHIYIIYIQIFLFFYGSDNIYSNWSNYLWHIAARCVQSRDEEWRKMGVLIYWY